MPDPLITLTTDFGHESPYVAAMKGVILGINPSVRLIDLSHQIPPQNLSSAAYFLRSAIPYFPQDVLHVIVVDPGVGTDRALLYVNVKGHRLLAPDNGCWTFLLEDEQRPDCAIALTESSYWRHPVSTTFHGRDILAPVAGHLSRGLDPAKLGPPVASWVSLMEPQLQVIADGLSGEIVDVDHFGNLISNIPGDMVRQSPRVVRVGKRTLRRGFHWVQAYAEAQPGELVVLVSSQGMLEIAVVQGNAAAQLRAGCGTSVTIGWAR